MIFDFTNPVVRSDISSGLLCLWLLEQLDSINSPRRHCPAIKQIEIERLGDHWDINKSLDGVIWDEAGERGRFADREDYSYEMLTEHWQLCGSSPEDVHDVPMDSEFLDGLTIEVNGFDVTRTNGMPGQLGYFPDRRRWCFSFLNTPDELGPDTLFETLKNLVVDQTASFELTNVDQTMQPRSQRDLFDKAWSVKCIKLPHMTIKLNQFDRKLRIEKVQMRAKYELVLSRMRKFISTVSKAGKTVDWAFDWPYTNSWSFAIPGRAARAFVLGDYAPVYDWLLENNSDLRREELDALEAWRHFMKF